jgi:hypothetical protein
MYAKIFFSIYNVEIHLQRYHQEIVESLMTIEGAECCIRRLKWIIPNIAFYEIFSSFKNTDFHLIFTGFSREVFGDITNIQNTTIELTIDREYAKFKLPLNKQIQKVLIDLSIEMNNHQIIVRTQDFISNIYIFFMENSKLNIF